MPPNRRKFFNFRAITSCQLASIARYKGVTNKKGAYQAPTFKPIKNSLA
ncbi:hypothetical protein M23134_06950 [Microscilla marina ATCC 23134]|uniref:Uncharacterized protein n=1 Tax=Microscilla marina ATCC 23134 TaxID=313606 RepID=A1ZYG3_MICM2|nr:hypothetical protein M23134_06950 [Microscilla marina ATCC 23134]